MNKINYILSFLIGIGISTSLFAQETTLISSTNNDIKIMGRTFTNENDHIEFDWPGITICANFTGSSIAIMMDDTKKNFYNVFIDEKEAKVIEVHSDTLLQLAVGMNEGEHQLKIVKRTEGEQGHATFKGLVLDHKGELLPPPAPGKRKIEFIGNSITCGYGTDSNKKDEAFRPETEDAFKAYGSITARAFNAEYHLVSHSGQGVVRNYGYKEETSPYTMPDRYRQTFDTDKKPLWDFNVWKPDMVVINLGTNDFSTQPFPNQTVFSKGYNQLIDFVRSNYGNIPIFCIVGPMTDEPCYSYVKKITDSNRRFKNDHNIFFVGIPTYLMIQDEDLGASYHPNYSGQIKMAEHLVPVISSVMGWEFNEIR